MIRMCRPLVVAVAVVLTALFGAGTAFAQRGCSVQVFEHANFQGASFRTDRDIAWVGDRGNDRISAIVVEAGTWEFYEHIDFGGRSFRMGPGEQPFVGQAWNDRISSMRCVGTGRRADDVEGAPRRRGCAVTLFEHVNFNGDSFDIRRDVPWVGDRWNDRISSIVVDAGVWEFFEDINYGGRSFRMGPGERPSMGQFWNDRISSFRCIG